MASKPRSRSSRDPRPFGLPAASTPPNFGAPEFSVEVFYSLSESPFVSTSGLRALNPLHLLYQHFTSTIMTVVGVGQNRQDAQREAAAHPAQPHFFARSIFADPAIPPDAHGVARRNPSPDAQGPPPRRVEAARTGDIRQRIPASATGSEGRSILRRTNPFRFAPDSRNTREPTGSSSEASGS